MTKTAAIKKHCSDCAGESYLDVVFCVLVDCPLWPFRLGVRAGMGTYNKRMDNSIESHRELVNDICADPQIAPFFQLSSSKTHHLARNKGRVTKTTGVE